MNDRSAALSKEETDGFDFDRLLRAAEEAVAISEGRLKGRTSTFRGYILVRIDELDGSVWTLEDGAEAFRSYVKENNDTTYDQFVKAARSCLRQSQAGFAQLLGISKKTLQNWEHGIRTPQGTAQRLVWMTALFPKEALEANQQQEELVLT